MLCQLDNTEYLSHTVQVANGGGLEALLIDAAGRLISKDYAQRVSSHEAGHFLVAYLIGLLPKKYIISSVDAFKRYNDQTSLLQLVLMSPAGENDAFQRISTFVLNPFARSLKSD